MYSEEQYFFKWIFGRFESTKEPKQYDPERKKKILKYIKIGLISTIALFFMFGVGSIALYYLTVSGYILDFLNWVTEIGYWGNLVMIILLLILNLPMTAGYGFAMIACGFIFKFWNGLITVIIGTQLGIFLAYAFFKIPPFHRRATDYINSKEILVLIMEELSNHMIKFSFLLRISPIPLGMQNVVLALSQMTFWQYHLTGFFALLSQQIPFVYVGFTLNDIAQVLSGSESPSVVNTIVVAVTTIVFILLIIFVGWIGKRVLTKLRLQKLGHLNPPKYQPEDHYHHSDTTYQSV